MADILIRGMDMPERCDAKCPLYNTGRGYFDCVITKRSYNWGLLGRPSDCPLVELPEHGDLIDRDALIKTCNEIIDEDWNAKAAPYSWSYAYESFVDDIVAMPVIVSASKEETE